MNDEAHAQANAEQVQVLREALTEGRPREEERPEEGEAQTVPELGVDPHDLTVPSAAT